MFRRALDLAKSLGTKKSAFLFGPRGTGKSTLARSWQKQQQHSLYVDLLQSETFRSYSQTPELFRKELEYQISRVDGELSVVIDEVQRVPDLLNEVHALMESQRGRVRFLLTGSSARKLKRGGANLLAGRALTLELGPLLPSEVKMPIERALRWGTLPVFWEVDEPVAELDAYVGTYLREEILQEALVRKTDVFTRLLDVLAQCNGQTVNHSKLAAQCKTSDKTIKSYFEILVDTLLVHELPAFHHSVRKQLVESPKYYVFDCGVLNALAGELRTPLRRSTFRYGNLFETWCIQLLRAHVSTSGSGHKMFHARSYAGQEVDCILARGAGDVPIAIEIKSSPQPKDLTGLHWFAELYPSAKMYCIADVKRPYREHDVTVLPWTEIDQVLAT
jgi:uncharacterized protein